MSQTLPSPEALSQEWLKWKATQPPDADTSADAFLRAFTSSAKQPEQSPNPLQRVNTFIGDALRPLSKFNPQQLVAGSPLAANGIFSGNYKDPITELLDPVPPTMSIQGISAGLGGLLDAPGETKYREVGRSAAESLPRTAISAATGMPKLVADMILQGYAGAKDAGLSSTQAMGAGLVSGGVGAIMPAFAKAGTSIAAQTMAKTPISSSVLQRGAEAAGANLAMLIPQMAQRPASELVTGQEISDPLSTENLLENAVSNVAMLPLSLNEVAAPRKAVRPDGTVVEFPSFTALEKANNSLARAKQTSDAMGKLYSQFMSDAQDVVSPLGGEIGPVGADAMSERLSTKARDTFGKLSEDELTALRPLEFFSPKVEDTVAREAHSAFVKAAGLDKPKADFMLASNRSFGVEKVDVKLDWTFGDEPEADGLPVAWVNQNGRGTRIAIERLDTAEQRGYTAYVISKDDKTIEIGSVFKTVEEAQAAVEQYVKTRPDFALTKHIGDVVGANGPKQPGWTVDYGDPKQLTPMLFLDRVIAGEIVPTGKEARDIQSVDLLRRVFGPQTQSGEDFVNMDRLNEFAALAGRVKMRQATPEEMQKWSKLDSTVQDASLLAARILQDPYAVGGGNSEAGLDATRWSVPQLGVDTQLRMLRDTASTLTARWNKPIETVDDAGALVKDVNFFLENVQKSLAENGFGPEAQTQLTEQTGFAPITETSLNAQYNKAVERYINSPTAEAAANTLQWVKNKILLAAQEARQVMLSKEGFQTAGKADPALENIDARADADFMASLENVPTGLKGIVGDLYNLRRAEKTNEKGEVWWALPRFREDITNMMGKLTPEQRSKLETIKNPLEGVDRQMLELYVNKDTKAIEALGAGQRTAYDAAVTQYEAQRKAVEPVLREIKVLRPREREERYTEAGTLKKRLVVKSEQTNLYDVFFKPEIVRSAPMDTRQGDKALGRLDTAPVETVGEESITNRKLSNEEVAQMQEDAGETVVDTTPAVERLAAPETESAQESALIAKYFQGEPKDPNEVLMGMSPSRLAATIETVFGKKSAWENKVAKYAQKFGLIANEVRGKPEVAAWMKDFLRAEYAGDGAVERKSWMVENQHVAKGNKWNDFRKNMLGTDKAKNLLLKTTMMGLELKPGVTADVLFQAAKGEKEEAKAPRIKQTKFEYDVRTQFSKYFMAQGYQPEVAKAYSDLLSGMISNYTWLDNAEFAMLTDKRGTAEKFFKDLRVLGVRIPVDSTVGGQRVRNPIIAVMFEDLIKNKEYAALNSFLKISVLAHESFHVFEDQIINNVKVGQLNEDTQGMVTAYRNMEKLSAEMSPEERVRTVSTLVDSMIPAKFTRDARGQFKPEISGIINGAVRSPKEFMAFYFQIVSTGLWSKLTQHGTLSKGTTEMRDAMMWLSRDEQNFIRGQFRYVGDMLEVLQKTLDDPEYRKSQGFVKTMQGERELAPGSPSVRLQTSAEGQTTERVAGPNVRKEKFDVTQPPTATVGTRARMLAEAAEQIAASRDNKPLVRKPGQTIAEAYFERQKEKKQEAGWISAGQTTPNDALVEARGMAGAVQDLAKVDMRVERAQAALQQLETTVGSTEFPTQMAQGPIRQIDVSDIDGSRDFMYAVLDGESAQRYRYDFPPPGFPSKNKSKEPTKDGKVPPKEPTMPAEGFFMGEDPKFSRNVFSRFMAALQPQQFKTQDLARRGLPIAERIRQTLNSVQPQAHLVNHSIMAPITERFGKFGSVRLDTTKDFFKFISDDGKTSDPAARKALNEILSAQQRMKGLKVTDPQMQPVITAALQKVAPPKRALVVTAVQTINDIYANKASQQLKFAAETQRNIIATTMMRMAPGKFNVETAKANALEAIRISELGDIMEMQNYSAMMQQQGLSANQADALLRISATAHVNNLNMQQQMANLGQFASEQRVGQYILAYVDGTKKKYEGVVDTAEGRRRQAELFKAGAKNFKVIDKAEMAEDAQLANSFEGLEAINQIVMDTFTKQMETLKTLDPTLAELMAKQFNPSTGLAEYTAVSTSQKNMLKRNLAGGRETVDYVETMFDNVGRTAVSLSRRNIREEYGMLALELEQLGHGNMVKEFNTQLAEVMTPDSPVYNKIKTAVTGWQVVNVANMVLEGVQLLGSGNTTLFREGLNTKQIYEGWNDSMRTLAQWYGSKKGEFNHLARIGQQIEANRLGATPMLENKEASVAFQLRRMNDEARLGHEALMDLNGEDLLQTNLARASRNNNFTWLDAGKFVANTPYQMSKNLLRMYSVMPRFNNWAAANMALRVGYDKGYRGQELYTYAIGLKDSMTISGGRANKPTAFAVEGTGKAANIARPAVGMLSMLSNYALGTTTLMLGSMKDATMGAAGLNPSQRVAAGKAAVNALAVQWSLAGVLGLPMAGALTWLIEELTGANAEKGMREFAKPDAMDDEFGNLLSDVAMNGWINRSSGLDFASKSGINSMFGVNGYNGFEPTAVFGPTGSLVKDMVEATGNLKDGQVLQALTKLVPKGVRGLVDTARSYAEYGDLRFMDKGNNLIYKAGAAETVGYALGLQPAGVKRAKQETRLTANAERRFSEKDARGKDQLARQLLAGDRNAVLQAAQSQVNQPGFDAKDFIGSVIDRAVDMQVVKDSSATGAKGNVETRRELMRLADGQPQEVLRVQTKAQLLQSLGNPLGLQTTQKDLLRAMVVDEIRRQKRVTRQEAVGIAEKLLGQ